MVNTRSQTKMADNADLLALLAEMKKSMEKIEEVRNEVQRKIEEIEGKVQRKIEEEEDKVQGKIEEVKEKVQVRIGDLEKRLCELEDRPINFPANPDLTYKRASVRSMTFVDKRLELFSKLSLTL
ncbi:hypothetical protein AVEN_114613-1 [Araneus ventricosus]|uniref:Uncharacterized protein n=1 Tax=Araneus ventricosus TaxID=182803 RepID=A0A4Y2GC53_ARAVE|nr:hypothetical protein AVEN_114613-1 [Araneus ventricosus]